MKTDANRQFSSSWFYPRNIQLSCDEIPDSDIIFAFKTAEIDRVLNQEAAYFEQKKMDLLL